MSPDSHQCQSHIENVKPAYYNEINSDAADRLEDLIAAGLIADGVVDRRSIEDICPRDLEGFTQCHFFAGFGVWSLALRRAGWPDDRPVWTGSCPCQPFSEAGKGTGFSDERHLWPSFHWLIQERRPPVVLGEQVASSDAGAWLDLVRDDVEGLAYAFGAVAFPSAGVGAPHIRDRTYWVAHASRQQRARATERAESRGRHVLGHVRSHGRLAHAERVDSGREAASTDHRQPQADRSTDRPGGCGGAPGGLADPALERWPGHSGSYLCIPERARSSERGGVLADDAAGPLNGPWRSADWLFCRDGRWRPVEPGTFPLAHGLPRGMGSMQPELRRLAELAGLDRKSLARAKTFRVGGLRGYGNAINAAAACAFIEAVMAVQP